VARGQTGGKRQGTPGKSYSNRTDLSTNYAPSTPTQTPASGGVPVPSGGGGQAAPPEQPQSWTSPDAVPALDDPTARPGEPVTHGLGIGPGGGPEVLGLGTAAEGLRRLNQQNREYFGYLSGRTDLPDRVAAFVRQVRNS
jgi:hypothetical protein